MTDINPQFQATMQAIVIMVAAMDRVTDKVGRLALIHACGHLRANGQTIRKAAGY